MTTKTTTKVAATKATTATKAVKTTATKAAKVKQESAVDIQSIIAACPYPSISNFEAENFESKSGVSYARFIIEKINRLRKVTSDLETEKRTYEKNCLLYEKSSIETLLAKEDANDIASAIENWQHVEKDYWINVLGKQAAIEIIANGKPDLDTMTKMVKLPEEAYVKATQICVKLANAIAAATEDAEAEIGFMADLPEKKVATGPRQLKLKKVK